MCRVFNEENKFLVLLNKSFKVLDVDPYPRLLATHRAKSISLINFLDAVKVWTTTY